MRMGSRATSRSWIGLDGIPADLNPAVVAIGNFDGVHLGHQRILRLATESARADSMNAVAVTFDPHPLAVVAPARAPDALTSVARRVELILRHGIDRVAVLPFTRDLARWSPRAFCEQILVGRLKARKVVVGSGFRFGREQSGTTETLRDLGSRLGFETAVARTVRIEGEPVSSTVVRALVRQGRVERARELLGREFGLRGPIIRGEGVGTRMTVPTLNLSPDSEVLPGDGVYVTRARLDGRNGLREAVTNVGLRPTFDGRNRTVETYMLGATDESTPSAIELEFLWKIRDERRFPSVDLLREQILVDIEAARRYFRQTAGSSGESPVEPARRMGPVGPP